MNWLYPNQVNKNKTLTRFENYTGVVEGLDQSGTYPKTRSKGTVVGNRLFGGGAPEKNGVEI